MKKILLIFVAVACMARAQTPVGGPANIANTLYASNFAAWTVAQGNNGPFSWSSPQVCTSANSGGVSFKPFVVGSPIRINDTASPVNSENVTVTAVNIIGSGCSITTSTPAHQHFSFFLSTATCGLQESLNYSIQVIGVNSPASVVLVTPAWSILGCSTSAITVTAQGTNAISIMDERSSVFVPYLWNGSHYVADPFGSGGSLVPFSEVPTGTVNGVNVTFGLDVTPQLLILSDNGLVLTPGLSYTNSGMVVTFVNPPPIGDHLYAQGIASSSLTVFAQVPSGTINGTNTVFTFTVSPALLFLTYNGQLLTPGVGYTLAGNTVTLTVAPQPGDTLYGQGVF